MGAEAIIDFVGEKGAVEDGIAMIQDGGFYYVIGYGQNIDIPTIDVISREISFIGNLVGTYVDLQDLMTLTAQGKVTLHTTTYPLDAINDAMADLDNGRLQGRGILVPAARVSEHAHPSSAAKNRAARGAATDPPERPRSTSTAIATSSRKAMNHAWVGGGFPPPNSAVPLLPRTSPSTPDRAVPEPSVTTRRIRARNVSRSEPASAGPARRGSAASSRGARQRPSATVAATRAIDSGLARISCWPIIAAARSTSSSPGGTWPRAAGTARSSSRPSP